jgi:hypothetical protein
MPWSRSRDSAQGVIGYVKIHTRTCRCKNVRAAVVVMKTEAGVGPCYAAYA